MAVRKFDGVEPSIADSSYVDEDAVVIGDVTIKDKASVWPGVVLRGDRGGITIEKGANIQDNAVCHEETLIKEYATVGHGAIVHGCKIGIRSLVGMNSIVLDNSKIGEESIIAAGSTVTEDKDIPPRSLVAGTPAEVKKQDIDSSEWFDAGERYVELSRKYKQQIE